MSKNYTNEEFVEAVKNSFSYAGVCRYLGLSTRGGNNKTIKRKIEELNLDVSHFTGQRWNKGLTSKDNPSIKRKSIDEILIKDSGWGSYNIKNRILEEGLKEYKCERCYRTEWEGSKIPLQLHHLNGVHTDNRLENLQLLCPNCHALTDNFSGKKSEEEKEITKQKRLEKAKEYRAKLSALKREKEAEKTIVKKEKPKKICPTCNKEFTPRSETSVYCSQKCAHAAVSKCPSKEELLLKFRELKSFLQVARYYGVSDNAVRKWCIKYDIPHGKVKLVSYLKEYFNQED